MMLSFAAAIASHSWGNYHFALDGAVADVVVLNSTTRDWDGYVTQAVADWNASTVINMTESNSTVKRGARRRCNAPDGKIRICNDKYGKNGWLGIASIWADQGSHITAGTTKLNDTYFNTARYSGADLKQSVTCQELGHNIGLDHQDTDFNNRSLFSCMDYQEPPFEFPNAHDYEQLENIYDHVDSSVATAGRADRSHPRDEAFNEDETQNWGQSTGRRGDRERFVKFYNDGSVRVTHVYWAHDQG